MKTVGQALVDEVHIPIPYGFVENACIKRDLDIESEFTGDVARSDAYKGTLADCLLSLIQAVSFSEADKSIGSFSEDQRKAILVQVNRLYNSARKLLYLAVENVAPAHPCGCDLCASDTREKAGVCHGLPPSLPPMVVGIVLPGWSDIASQSLPL